MVEHLGHDRGGTPGPGGNVRNGHSGKTVRTEIGEVRIQVSRDRAGSCDPVLVSKHAWRLPGFDETVISVYAKELTTGDIVNHRSDVTGEHVSRDLVSRVTDALGQMQQWEEPGGGAIPAAAPDQTLAGDADGAEKPRVADVLIACCDG